MGRHVVQLRPGDLDLLQLPQAVFAKVIGDALVSCFARIHSELAVQARPGEPQRTLQREGPIGQPQIDINAPAKSV